MDKRVVFSGYTESNVFLYFPNKRKILSTILEYQEKYKVNLFAFIEDRVFTRQRRVILNDPSVFALTTTKNILKFIGPERSLNLYFIYNLLSSVITEEEIEYMEQFKGKLELSDNLVIDSDYITIDYSKMFNLNNFNKMATKRIITIKDEKIKEIYLKVKTIYPFKNHFPELEFYFSIFFINHKYYKVLFYYFLHLMKYHLLYKYVKSVDAISLYISFIESRLEINIKKLINRFYSKLNITDSDFLAYLSSCVRSYIFSRNKIHTIVKSVIFRNERIKVKSLSEKIYEDSDKFSYENKFSYEVYTSTGYKDVYCELENDMKDEALERIYKILNDNKNHYIILTDFIRTKIKEGYNIFEDKSELIQEVRKVYGAELSNAFSKIISELEDIMV